MLGPTFDYTHRLLDFTLMADGGAPVARDLPVETPLPRVPHVTSFLNRDGLIETARGVRRHAPRPDP